MRSRSGRPAHRDRGDRQRGRASSRTVRRCCSSAPFATSTTVARSPAWTTPRTARWRRASWPTSRARRRSNSRRTTSSSSIGSATLDARRRERRDRRRASASRPRVRREPLRDRAAQAARSDLEARALRRRKREWVGTPVKTRETGRLTPENAAILRPTAHDAERADADDAARPIRPQHRVSPHLGHGSLQLPLRVLHARDGNAVAAEVGDSVVRGDRRASSDSSRRSGCDAFESPAASRRFVRRSTS